MYGISEIKRANKLADAKARCAAQAEARASAATPGEMMEETVKVVDAVLPSGGCALTFIAPLPGPEAAR